MLTIDWTKVVRLLEVEMDDEKYMEPSQPPMVNTGKTFCYLVSQPSATKKKNNHTFCLAAATKVTGPLGLLSVTVIIAVPSAEVIALYTYVRKVCMMIPKNSPEVRHSVEAAPRNIGNRVVGVPVSKPSHCDRAITRIRRGRSRPWGGSSRCRCRCSDTSSR